MARVAPGAIQDRYKRVIQAWSALAPAKTFGGYTLKDVQAMETASESARDAIDDLEARLTGAIQTRDDLDDTIVDALELAVNGVRADKSVGGADGALYKAMGFVPKSERKPRARKPKPTE